MDIILKRLPKAHFSVPEVAHIIGITRQAALKQIKSGRLQAQKVGRNYIIARTDLETALGSSVSPEQKNEIERIVKKVVKQYCIAFRRFGKEE